MAKTRKPPVKTRKPPPRKPAARSKRPARPSANRGQASMSKGSIAALAVVGVAILAFVGWAAVGANSTNDSGSTDPAAFDLPAIGDSATRIRKADYAGQPLVVNFFASWCTACDAELPGFAKLSRELEGEVAFVGVAAQETGDAMLMPERHGITWWPLARDIGGRNGSGLHQALGGRGMPITAFYDADGTLIHVDTGAIPEQALRERLASFYGVQT